MNGNGEPIPFDRATILGSDGKAEAPHITAQMCLANAANGVPPDQVVAMALVGILHQLEQRQETLEGDASHAVRVALRVNDALGVVEEKVDRLESAVADAGVPFDGASE